MSRSISRVLVANRGEIARRVFRTCRDLGIGTAAVHSGADAEHPFVREADVAVRLPGSSPGETYLRSDLVVAAAQRCGADAVHPGYGFLSENAGFARAVLDAGLVWIGPSPEAMEQMASKVGAKRLMAEAGVPVLPELDPAALTEADLPLLVKASAGGGGRGMRVVTRLDDVPAAVAAAADEAGSAFGDATVFCEPYVVGGRHVEVQVWGDFTGENVTVLGARDCSVQRRHQKVIEEAPPPFVPDETVSALGKAARAAAEAISYSGAGTVEFLYDAQRDAFWFLEMNTRLQVEHPVTEAVTGLDLVELQLVAATPDAPGGSVTHPAAPADGPGRVAVEARLYAEDPADGWAPQSGLLTRFHVPGVRSELDSPPLRPDGRDGIRLDAAVEAGSVVGTHYDAMLAKVVSVAADRRTACEQLALALERAEIHGVVTNRDLLVEVLRHREFLDDGVGTDFLERARLRALTPSVPGTEAERAHAAFAAAVALATARTSRRQVQARVPLGWRSVASAPLTSTFTLRDGSPLAVAWRHATAGPSLVEPGAGAGVVATSVSAPGSPDDPWVVVLDDDGLRRTHRVFLAADAGGPEAQVDVEAPFGHLALKRVPRFTDPTARVAEGSLLAPMPGTVTSVAVSVGDTVGAGGLVLVLEAMKMQHTVTAPADGVVTQIAVAPGDQVAAGSVLAVVEHPDSPESEDA